MNFTKLVAGIFLLPVFFACENGEEKSISGQVTPQEKKQTNIQAHTFDCHTLTNKQVIYNLAKEIIEKNESGGIWNLSDIDTTDFFTTEDYFINANTKNTLISIGGEAGLSAGSANHLLILFSCTDTLGVVWYEQTGKVTAADITDVNGDGIKELVCNTGYVWMGECGDNYRIVNFKDGRKNILFNAHSTSLLGCGRDDVFEFVKQGDTVENSYNCSLQKLNDKSSVIRQIQTVKIYQGGETEEEITNRLKVVVDTMEVQLK